MLLPDVVTIDKEIMSGTPVFKGTRVPVKNLIDYLEGVYDIEVFLDHFPAVKREQVIKLLEALGREYLLNHLMPEKYAGDALHLALASMYNIDYLLTWNCNHLANANKRRHIRTINAKLGLTTPEIVTPLELFREEE